MAGLQVDNRLVNQSQLITLDGSSQVVFDLQGANDRDAHLVVENDILVLAAMFGFIHRNVGIPQHFFRAGVGTVADGDSDGRGTDDIVPLQLEGLAHGFDDPLGDDNHLFVVLKVFDKNGKFITAETGNRICRTQTKCQSS